MSSLGLSAMTKAMWISVFVLLTNAVPLQRINTHVLPSLEHAKTPALTPMEHSKPHENFLVQDANRIKTGSEQRANVPPTIKYQKTERHDALIKKSESIPAAVEAKAKQYNNALKDNSLVREVAIEEDVVKMIRGIVHSSLSFNSDGISKQKRNTNYDNEINNNNAEATSLSEYLGPGFVDLKTRGENQIHEYGKSEAMRRSKRGVDTGNVDVKKTDKATADVHEITPIKKEVIVNASENQNQRISYGEGQANIIAAGPSLTKAQMVLTTPKDKILPTDSHFSATSSSSSVHASKTDTNEFSSTSDTDDTTVGRKGYTTASSLPETTEHSTGENTTDHTPENTAKHTSGNTATKTQENAAKHTIGPIAANTPDNTAAHTPENTPGSPNDNTTPKSAASLLQQNIVELPASPYADKSSLRKYMSCEHVPSFYSPRWLWMVTDCPDFWTDDSVRERCRSYSESHSMSLLELLVSLPVQDSRGTVYANEFCAKCQGLDSPKPWKAQVDCKASNFMPEIPNTKNEFPDFNRQLSNFFAGPDCETKIQPAVPMNNPNCQVRYC
ncbi:hypothetical protein EGW08_001290 [Elysia chlorotica]|uniref:Uncharacterized protein n=1 Tax=Elysia chlorotica TaxID=188477 RepID=A0A3S1AG26_ELYCH|nr:hypothetical protein EGW08_001290 [Elysia chlorotica]